MNKLMTANTMTSIQVAEMAGKQHQHIMRDIRDEAEKLAAGGLDNQSKFGLSERRDSTGRTVPFYILSREGVLQLAARYDAVTRAKLIDMAMKVEKSRLPEFPDFPVAALNDIIREERELLFMLDHPDIYRQHGASQASMFGLANDDWRKTVNENISRITEKTGGKIIEKYVWEEAFLRLEARFHCNRCEGHGLRPRGGGDLMFCPQCGNQTADRDNFCSSCGKRQGNRITPDLMTPKDVQEATGLSQGEVYRLFNSRKFPSTRIGGKHVIPRGKFLQWMGETPK